MWRDFPLNNSIDNPHKVLEETGSYLDKHPEASTLLAKHIRAYRNLMDLIPETVEKLFSGHIFPYSESFSDFESSIHLAAFGYYKPALVSLRSSLELGLVYLYYDRDNNSEEVIRNWLASQEPTPFKRKIIGGLARIGNVQKLLSAYPVLEKVGALYSELSNYVHTAGAPYSSRELNRTNVTMFSEQAFLKWLNYLTRCVHDLSVLFLMKYPVGLQHTAIDEKFGLNGPAGGYLNPHQVDQIREILDPQLVPELQAISDSDPNAMGIARAIQAMPDLNEEEWEQQSVEWDKNHIESFGYQWWYDNYVKNVAENEEGFLEHMGERISSLEQWAKENGHYH